MFQRKVKYITVLAVIVIVMFIQTGFVFAGSILLKIGMSGEEVSVLQSNLKSLGYFEQAPTGYFGSITESAVINFQKSNNLTADGVAGSNTLNKINLLLKKKPITNRGDVSRVNTEATDKIALLSWFKEVNGIFRRGDTAKVTDVDTGLSLMVQRTYGTNHADVEALTSEDTAILKKIAGGEWNWTRRAAIVTIDGYKIAASITAMPHAGRDDKPAEATVDGRSAGYGRGINLDKIKGNNMDGHFDIHFLDSRTSETNRVDEKHQQMVKKAYQSDK